MTTTRRSAGTRALVCLIALTAACGPGEIDDAIFEDDGDWELNDLPDERQAMATCPNGGKTVPNAPVFGKSIDGYASYVGQSTCDPTAKPGVVAFKNLVLKTYPCTKDYGITRACNVGGTSEHKEGRAWDWGLNYPHPAATSFLGWLLATDAHGNKHAMARRLGIMYMIWNRKIWKSYQASKGWQSYSGSNPHTDHVHFSFSWNGAKKKTSFWNPPPQPPPNQPPKGWLNSAKCPAIKGWAHDPDTKAKAITVVVNFDGATSYKVTADQYRADLCSTVGCNHAFELKTPAKLKDGKTHTVRAYGVDTASGKKTELNGSPKKLTCEAPAPPSTDTGPEPTAADAGVPPASEGDTGVLLEEDGMATPIPSTPGTPGTPVDDPTFNTTLGGGCQVGRASGHGAAPMWSLLLLLVIVGRRLRPVGSGAGAPAGARARRRRVPGGRPAAARSPAGGGWGRGGAPCGSRSLRWDG